MDRKDFYYRQRVTQAELDAAFASAEVADRDIVKDTLGSGFLISGPAPATVIENTVPDSNVLANEFLGYDQNGQRLSNARSGYQGGVDKGLPAQLVDMLVDELAVATTVTTPGNEKILSIFVEFTRDLSDPRLDGSAATVYHIANESIKFNVVQSAEAPVGTATPPPLRSDQLLLADVTRIFAQTVFLNADIDQSRRQAFALVLLHGGTHVEGGADPIPNATGSVGGLMSAVDKTRFDILPETAADVANLFPNQFRDFQPANVLAPAATTLDVTSTFVAQTPGGSTSVEGFVTTAPHNLSMLRRVNGDAFLEQTSGNGNQVQARLTEAAGVWTLSFFYLDETTGAETPYDMTPFSGQTIVWITPRAYKLHNLPSSNPLRSVPSDQVAGEVPTAGVGSLGLVEAATGAPTPPRAGVINQFENNGVPLAGGPFHKVNWVAGGATSPAAGEVDIPAPAGVGQVVDSAFVDRTTPLVVATLTPYDNTIPQNTEGGSIFTLAFTPKSLANYVEFEVTTFLVLQNNQHVILHLHDSAVANALAASAGYNFPGAVGNVGTWATLKYRALASSIWGSLVSKTFDARVGPSGGSAFVNSDSSGLSIFGGVARSTFTIKEYLP